MLNRIYLNNHLRLCTPWHFQQFLLNEIKPIHCEMLLVETTMSAVRYLCCQRRMKIHFSKFVYSSHARIHSVLYVCVQYAYLSFSLFCFNSRHRHVCDAAFVAYGRSQRLQRNSWTHNKIICWCSLRSRIVCVYRMTDALRKRIKLCSLPEDQSCWVKLKRFHIRIFRYVSSLLLWK